MFPEWISIRERTEQLVQEREEKLKVGSDEEGSSEEYQDSHDEGEELDESEGEGQDEMQQEEGEEDKDQDEDEDEDEEVEGEVGEGEGEGEEADQEEDDKKDLEAFMKEMEAQDELAAAERSLEEREMEDEDQEAADKKAKPKGKQSEKDGDQISDPEDLFDTLAYGTTAKNISRIEKGLVGKKSWQLKGEVRAKDRPVDALLEAEVDFDVGLQSKVVISRELNQKFEAIIKQRILDMAFDDREMPAPTKLKVREQNNQFEDLDFEKDKRGLTGVYEDEYKKTVLGNDTEKSKADKLKEEIARLFRNICFCVDSMSRGHFTPNSARFGAPSQPESQVVFDEKIPVFVSANLVDNKKTFSEVHKPEKSDFKAMGEMGRDERRAVKRKIKEARHRISQKIKEETRVKAGISVKDSKLLEKNKSKVSKQIQDSGVVPTKQVKASNFFGTLEGLKRVKTT